MPGWVKALDGTLEITSLIVQDSDARSTVEPYAGVKRPFACHPMKEARRK